MQVQKNMYFLDYTTYSVAEAKEESPHAGLCNNNGRQIDCFHMKWFACRWISKF